MVKLSNEEIKRRIYLSGTKHSYQVHHHIPGEEIIAYVSSVDVGNTIVRALRERARSRGELVKRRAELVTWSGVPFTTRKLPGRDRYAPYIWNGIRWERVNPSIAYLKRSWAEQQAKWAIEDRHGKT